jgi:hypothetical protein
MKINFFTLMMSVLIGLLVAFFLSKYTLEENKIMFAIGCFISITSGIAGIITLNFDYSRTNVLIKVTSGIFLSVFLAINILFSIFNEYDYSSYVLATGIALIIFILSIYTISKMKV